ncbi:hypothetical protein [Abyssalbus ytuae]|uniref:Uncharacterized protein n=1 Tax=Abyssalbus ytuae TaxID=2926907 RepID=A0A9E7CTS0_9FLAO|nr:hypothetical protein [Abyssalbus ytuae]UOB16692.1 hypothetical protein MQE35_13210 [Abyssalbus ytuae]
MNKNIYKLLIGALYLIVLIFSFNEEQLQKMYSQFLDSERDFIIIFIGFVLIIFVAFSRIGEKRN